MTSRVRLPSIITRDRPDLRRDIAAQVEHHLVNIAPAPAFGRIVTLDYGMAGPVKMLGGMLAPRLVAEADMATSPADAQVKPLPAQLQAFRTAFGAGRDFL